MAKVRFTVECAFDAEYEVDDHNIRMYHVTGEPSYLFDARLGRKTVIDRLWDDMAMYADITPSIEEEN